MPQVLPTPLLAITLLSVILATTTFILSLQNYSVLSLGIGVLCSVATLIYHLTFFYISYRRITKSTYERPYSLRDNAFFYTSGIAFGYVLLTLWIISFGVNAQITFAGRAGVRPEDVNGGRQWNASIMLGESVVMALEATLLLVFVVYGQVQRRRKQVAKRAGSEDKYYVTASGMVEWKPNQADLKLSPAWAEEDLTKMPIVKPQPAIVVSPATPNKASV